MVVDCLVDLLVVDLLVVEFHQVDPLLVIIYLEVSF